MMIGIDLELVRKVFDSDEFELRHEWNDRLAKETVEAIESVYDEHFEMELKVNHYKEKSEEMAKHIKKLEEMLNRRQVEYIKWEESQGCNKVEESASILAYILR